MTANERPTVDLHPIAAWAVLVTASLGVLIAGAELMVVAIALPSIVADFGGWSDLARASWIVNAYLLAFVVAMPLAGRAADLWGARRLYLVALLLFAAGSLGSGLAPVAGPDAGMATGSSAGGWSRAWVAAPWSRCRWPLRRTSSRDAPAPLPWASRAPPPSWAWP